MIVDMMAASDNEEHRECAQLDNAVEVVAGLAWQYFKQDWDRVSLAAWLAAILLRMAVWLSGRMPGCLRWAMSWEMVAAQWLMCTLGTRPAAAVPRTRIAP